MTCRVLLTGPDGSSVEARCLLDNASSASFITEHNAQILQLPRSYQSVFVSKHLKLEYVRHAKKTTKMTMILWAW